MGIEETEQKRQDRLLRNVLFTFFVSGAASQSLGALLPVMRESYGFSYDFQGLLLSCQSVGNLAAVLLTGFLPAYLGRRRTILSTAGWMAAGYLIFTCGTGAPAFLLAACVMMGVARGSNANFSNTVVSTLPAEKSARGFNLLHGAFAVGALLSPLLLVLCSFRRGGWRLMTGILFLMCLCQFGVYAKMDLPAEGGTKEKKGPDPSFLKVKQFWLGTAILFFYMSTEYAITGWLVTYFLDVGILPAELAQMTNSLLWLVIFAGRMVGAAVTGRVSRNSLLVVDGIGFFLFFLLMFFSRTPGVVVLALAGAGFFMATIYPTAFAFGSEYIKGNDLGNSVMILTGSAGGILTPSLVGFVAERTGNIQSGMALVAVYTGLLLVCILFSVWSVRGDSGKRE